jgi:hypothetical protein
VSRWDALFSFFPFFAYFGGWWVVGWGLLITKYMM